MIKRTEVLVQPDGGFWWDEVSNVKLYACSLRYIWNLDDFKEIRICASNKPVRGGIRVWMDINHFRGLHCVMYALKNWSLNSFPKAKSLWFWIEEA